MRRMEVPLFAAREEEGVLQIEPVSGMTESETREGEFLPIPPIYMLSVNP